MTPKQLQARTEQDLKAISKVVEDRACKIGYRFGDIDGTMDTHADELRRMVDRWVQEQRDYMRECVTENFWTGI